MRLAIISDVHGNRGVRRFHKKHLGIHPGVLDRFPGEPTERLTSYKTSKGAIQMPYDKPIDYELIADITRWRVSVVGG